MSALNPSPGLLSSADNDPPLSLQCAAREDGDKVTRQQALSIHITHPMEMGEHLREFIDWVQYVSDIVIQLRAYEVIRATEL